MKSEPSSYSWDDMLHDKVTCWDGVRNYQAQNNMKAMNIGDAIFFYHSNIGKEVVGIVEVVKEYYPDHTDKTGKFIMVDVKCVNSFDKYVSLKQIKSIPELSDMALVKQSRLSVSPVRKEEWDIIVSLGNK